MYYKRNIVIVLIFLISGLLQANIEKKYSNQDINVLEKILILNPHLNQDNPLKIGTQVWNNNRLTYLNLFSEKIKKLPESLGDLNQLVYLNLDLNQLTYMPESTCDLVSLKELYLSDNALIYIPEKIFK